MQDRVPESRARKSDRGTLTWRVDLGERPLDLRSRPAHGGNLASEAGPDRLQPFIEPRRALLIRQFGLDVQPACTSHFLAEMRRERTRAHFAGVQPGRLIAR